MKRTLSLALALVMLSALFTGCGCMDNTVSEHPGGVITDPTTMPTVLPTPTATHRPEDTTIPMTTGRHEENTTPRDTPPGGTEGSSSPTETTNQRNRHAER